MGDVAGDGRQGAHICVLGVDASDEVGETVLLLVFVWDEDGINIEVALVDLQSGFIGNTVPISEGRGARMMVSGHVRGSVRRSS